MKIMSKGSPDLPAEYEQLDSVLGGDRRYLNTHFKCSEFYGCEIEICMKVHSSAGDSMYLLNGAYDPGKTAQSGLITNGRATCFVTMNYGFSQSIYSNNISRNEFHTLYMSDGEQRVDGVPYAYENYGTLTDYVYLLFARRDSEGITSPGRQYIKYFWVKKDGDYLLNYIPARRKSDGKIGFYDTVSETFNIGTENLQSGGEYAGWVDAPVYEYTQGAWVRTTENKYSNGSWNSPNTRLLSKGKSEIRREYRDVKEPVPEEKKDEQIKR